MAVSLKKPEKVDLSKPDIPRKLPEYTPVYLIDEEETIKSHKEDLPKSDIPRKLPEFDPVHLIDEEETIKSRFRFKFNSTMFFSIVSCIAVMIAIVSLIIAFCKPVILDSVSTSEHVSVDVSTSEPVSVDVSTSEPVSVDVSNLDPDLIGFSLDTIKGVFDHLLSNPLFLLFTTFGLLGFAFHMLRSISRPF